MKLLLGSLLLAGVCWVEAILNLRTMVNFHNEKIANVWYPLLIIPTPHAGSLDFLPFMLEAQPHGNLKYSFRLPSNGVCITQDVTLEKQSQPGKFATIEVPSTLKLLEVDYDHYFIAHVTRGFNKEESFLAFVGTQPSVTPALEKKFRKAATRMGITGEILRSHLQETC